LIKFTYTGGATGRTINAVSPCYVSQRTSQKGDVRHSNENGNLLKIRYKTQHGFSVQFFVSVQDSVSVLLIFVKDLTFYTSQVLYIRQSFTLPQCRIAFRS